ncbi:MAG: hypothetical protein WC460_01875 [Patescibacteria group bacterium]
MNCLIKSERLHFAKEKTNLKNFILHSQVRSRKSLIMLTALILVTCACYLWQTNSLATKGYKIKELEDKVADLRKENKDLQLGITELRSTDRIAKEVENLQMVSVARIEYLQADGTAVAMNR